MKWSQSRKSNYRFQLRMTNYPASPAWLSPMYTLRRLSSSDLPRLRQFWVEHWGGEEMITRGHVHRSEQLEGFVVEDGEEWVGLLTFLIRDGECEVTSLDSLREGRGIGSKLLDQALEESRVRGCKRLFLITTNERVVSDTSSLKRL